MTHEDFAHICLRIKEGDTSIEIPCCANCVYYYFSKYHNKWYCFHPCRVSDISEELCTKPEDFCSRYKEKEE